MEDTDILNILDVRSYERIVVASNYNKKYPENWTVISKREEINGSVDEASVVFVDKVELTKEAFVEFISQNPRLFAIAVKSIEHEKNVRRILSQAYPFYHVWTFSTDFGKLLVTDAKGSAFDPDFVIDERAHGEA